MSNLILNVGRFSIFALVLVYAPASAAAQQTTERYKRAIACKVHMEVEFYSISPSDVSAVSDAKANLLYWKKELKIAAVENKISFEETVQDEMMFGFRAPSNPNLMSEISGCRAHAQFATQLNSNEKKDHIMDGGETSN